MKVQELMTTNVRTCNESDPVSTAAKLMADVNCGAVPVMDDSGKLVGMLTDRDVVLRAVATGKDVGKVTCGEVMSKPVTTCPTDWDAHQAAGLMAEKQIRRLPVMQGDKMVGIVALGDLATASIHVDEAGQALSTISEPSEPYQHGPF